MDNQEHMDILELCIDLWDNDLIDFADDDYQLAIDYYAAEDLGNE